MNNILPDKIIVKVSKGKTGVYIADMPELNTHVEAESIFELVTCVNNAIKLYYDLPENSPILFAPYGLQVKSGTRKNIPMDFLKYYPSAACNNLC
jgi:hypothetical protein